MIHIYWIRQKLVFSINGIHVLAKVHFIVKNRPDSKIPGRTGGYPAGPPTDPDVKDYLIRFLGDQSLGTTLAHNFAALQAMVLDVMDYSGFGHGKRLKNRDHKLVPVDVALVASPTQPVLPVSLYIVVDVINAFPVTTDTVILVMPLNLKAEHLILLSER